MHIRDAEIEIAKRVGWSCYCHEGTAGKSYVLMDPTDCPVGIRHASSEQWAWQAAPMYARDESACWQAVDALLPRFGGVEIAGYPGTWRALFWDKNPVKTVDCSTYATRVNAMFYGLCTALNIGVEK